jgi:hypothetical protein
MAKESNTVAILALCVSIGTAAFSIYQWRSSQTESKINSAIEISKQYIRDKELSNGRNELISAQEEIPTAGTAAAYSFREYIDYLEYISYLANNSRVDEQYISPTLQCDIWEASVLLVDIGKKHSIKFDEPEINIFAGRISPGGSFPRCT